MYVSIQDCARFSFFKLLICRIKKREEKLVSVFARKIWKGEGREKQLEGISSNTAALLTPCFKLPVN